MIDYEVRMIFHNTTEALQLQWGMKTGWKRGLVISQRPFDDS